MENGQGEEMEFSIFSFLLVSLILFTVTVKRNLHVFEMMFIWMTMWLVTHSLSSILIENLGLVSVSQDISKFLEHVLKRLILYPLITIHFINFIVTLKNKRLRFLVFLINIIVMSMFEFTFIHLRVLINHHYSWWISAIQWTIALTITYGFWLWYRKKYLLR